MTALQFAGLRSERLRVVSVNIWNRAGGWAERAPLIRAELLRLDADLVGLQEVMALDGVAETQAHELAEGLGYHVAYGAATEIGSGLRLGNAVLSRFPIGREHRRALPRSDEDEPRALLGVEVDSPYGRIPFFVTHLDWRLHAGAARQRQVAHITEALDEILASPSADEDHARFPAILVGDFNAEPLSDEIRYLSGYHAIGGRTVYWAECHRATGGGSDTGHTFVPSQNPFAAPTHEPDRRIDYIFARGPDSRLRGKPLSCRTCFDVPGGERGATYPSDHFGVYAELSTGRIE